MLEGRGSRAGSAWPALIDNFATMFCRTTVLCIYAHNFETAEGGKELGGCTCYWPALVADGRGGRGSLV